ncbi:putative serine/threonine-protein kinase 35-like [Apostichopus japonicus]|uniref:Putative serine/threonine-protein kinase 35-like n=1 Tax=Stichopus japonicus TaxID=307972 RepID=A0A2G8K7Y0_STIJA|nr:putative serine/threonine-protein kinase 35-like [Apostichopus japonicus]
MRWLFRQGIEGSRKRCRGKVRHAKVVTFQSLAKTKLAAESLRQDIKYRQLEHKNVLKFKDAFDMVESGRIYLCTVWSHYEKEQTELLNDFLINRKESLGIEESKALMVQLVEGVSFLHVNALSHNALTPFSVCGRPYDENYRPDGGRIRSMLYHLPPEAFGRSWDRCCKNYTNTAADVFMLGLLFIAIAEQTLLPPEPKTESNAKSKDPENPIVAPFLQYPGYAPIPLGKFLHGNSSIDVDQQLYQQSSPALRSLVRRMLQLIPGKRPPTSSVAQILASIRLVRRTDKAGSQSSLADTSVSSSTGKLGKRKRSSSLRYDPTEAPPKRKSSVNRLPSLREKTEGAKEVGSALVRRASVRMKTTRNFIMRKGSVKISE